MGTNKEETVIIGDQLLTDVLGGNRADFIRFLLFRLPNQMDFLHDLTAN